MTQATEAQILSCAWFHSSVAASTTESLMQKAFRLNNVPSTFSAMTEKGYKAIQIFIFIGI